MVKSALCSGNIIKSVVSLPTLLNALPIQQKQFNLKLICRLGDVCKSYSKHCVLLKSTIGGCSTRDYLADKSVNTYFVIFYTLRNVASISIVQLFDLYKLPKYSHIVQCAHKPMHVNVLIYMSP